MAGKSEEVVVKKYPNRRLYDTSTSSYITLEDVKRLVIEKKPVKVVDAKTNQDLTRQTLMQIMLEEESGGQPIFTAEMLAQVISFYGHAQQSALGPYLEASLKSYVNGVEALAKQAAAARGKAKQGADALMAANAAAWGEIVKAQQDAVASVMEKVGQSGWFGFPGKK